MNDEVKERLKKINNLIINIGGFTALINMIIGIILIRKGITTGNIQFLYSVAFAEIVIATLSIFGLFMFIAYGMNMSFEAFAREEIIKELLKNIVSGKKDIDNDDTNTKD